jgi:hypothetical protein
MKQASSNQRLLSLAVLAASAALTACTSPPLDPGNIVPQVIRSPLPSDVAYHRILAASRACYAEGDARVHADYSPAARHGTFHYSSNIDDARVELAQIEVERDIGGSSVVVMRLRGQERNEFVAVVEPWLRGETVPCPYPGDSESLRFP